MKGRETIKGAPSADLLVCFPSRAHLTWLPKPICSPARPAEATKRHHSHLPHRLKKSSTTGGGGGGGGGQASPLLWAKNKQMGSEITEPTSPKVTCAGQIKVRHKATACKSWLSVMEEIERIRNSRENKKRSSWIDSLGFKKDVMQFLTCLRNIRFDFRCFGSIPQSDITTDDDEADEEEEEYQENHGGSEANEASRTMFSKWFMVLQENQNSEFCQEKKKEEKEKDQSFFDHESIAAPSVPPPNALLLMRCRSAPAKDWLEEKEEHEEEEEEEEKSRKTEEEKKGKNLKALIEEEKRNSKKDLDSLVVMRYDADFYKISSDIAKETWVVGGMKDPLSRSRSWKR